MEIPINTVPTKCFKVILSVSQPLVKIRPTEAEVLAALMALDYSNPNLAKEILLSTSMRKIVRESLNMSENSFNNSLCNLKKKKMVIDGHLNPLLKKLYPVNNEFVLTYKIKVNG